jgi:hypothetical protein
MFDQVFDQVFAACMRSGRAERYPPNVRSITDTAAPGVGFMIKADGERFRSVIAHFT